MILDDFEAVIKRYPALGDEVVQSAESKRIYYLIRGRNAWHSTWVQHYFPGCMSTRLGDAEADAERKRGNGNVYYITELPALAFQCSKGVFLVTQINTTSPLIGYSPQVVTKAVAEEQILAPNAQNCYLREGSPLGRLAMSFKHDSPFWKRAPPAANSVIRLFAQGISLGRLESFDTHLSIRKSSASGGPKNALCWSIGPGKLEAQYVKALAEDFEIETGTLEEEK